MRLAAVPERRLARIKGRARAGSERKIPPKAPAYVTGRPTLPTTETVGQTDGDRRRSIRVRTTSEVLVRRLGGFNFSVALKDISAGGCRVEMLDPTEVGDPVVARLPQLEPLGSRVCWAEGTTAGVQFLTTIHPAVFDTLLMRLSTQEHAPAD